MSKETKVQFADIQDRLAEATKLNGDGQHGAALQQAHHVSEYLAAAYLAATIGQALPHNDATYDLFAETIRANGLHPVSTKKIGEIVGKVCALREAYHPALLDETTLKDAQQMIDHVAALLKLVEATVK